MFNTVLIFLKIQQIKKCFFAYRRQYLIAKKKSPGSPAGTKFAPLWDWKIRGCQLHQCLKSKKKITGCLESVDMYTHPSTPPSAGCLPQPSETSTAQHREAPGPRRDAHARGGFHHPHPTPMGALFSCRSRPLFPPCCGQAATPAP